MARLEDITVGCLLMGILPDCVVTVIQLEWIGQVAVKLTFKDSTGRLGDELIYRDRENSISIEQDINRWSLDADANLYKLVSEALRIKSAYLFDPLAGVSTSLIDPLPHQITAVYEEMIPRQPLRFLLADDPGAGKTIMTGLLIKELILRGDVQRCMIVCPGNLVEQWQEELYRRFHLPFEIMTNDKFETARSGNWFSENALVICRLDKLSRNEQVEQKLRNTEWDLIVCDEAHKMSATFSGGEIKKTKRFNLGVLLSTLTRHFLLLTATPHNGKEEDFQLFLSLIDPDRFEGQFKSGVHSADVSDLMRRMVKEDLVKFDGKPLFPERYAYSVEYELSDIELDLYEKVTEYVREEFNRADKLLNNGRRNTIGFALTILQRRLASSPEAIYQSLKRRREKLEKLLLEIKNAKIDDINESINAGLDDMDDEDIDNMDDHPEDELETEEEQLVNLASAARTIEELKAEIETLLTLEKLAKFVRESECDRKWKELSQILVNNPEMYDSQGNRRKLIVFSEHRDTLRYLHDRISTLIQDSEAVVVIHGGLGRDERRKAQLQFTQDKKVQVLVATDAAGEGINLQRANLMVNYDLPWNPNRLEQRFGRIHRIGQKEVCHCWNLVASKTREGDVYQRLLQKIETERKDLGGKVFDVLGKLVFDGEPLKKLLLKAIRYGDQPEVRERLNKVIDDTLDTDKLRKLMEDNAFAHDSIDASKISKIREEMERAEARRLQPHFIAAFFIEAFKLLGGNIIHKETGRHEIKNVPAMIRNYAIKSGTRDPILTKYERVTFEKDLINIEGKPLAEYICLGHPLLDATIELIIGQYSNVLRQGTIMVDDSDDGLEIKALICVENIINDGRLDKNRNRVIASKQLHFLNLTYSGEILSAGYAPYLNYRMLSEQEVLIADGLIPSDFSFISIEENCISYAVTHLVPKQLLELKQRRVDRVEKISKAVSKRLCFEIAYWHMRAEQLRQQEQTGKANSRLNSNKAKSRAVELERRLKSRLIELNQERHITPAPPTIIGAAIVIPIGLIKSISNHPDNFRGHNCKIIETIAMEAVMKIENLLGYHPIDVSSSKCGYDIESRVPKSTDHLRFIEVKGRAYGAETVTVTKNEILTGLNKPDQFILAIVIVNGDQIETYYIRNLFTQDLDFGVTSVNYKLADLSNVWKDPS